MLKETKFKEADVVVMRIIGGEEIIARFIAQTEEKIIRILPALACQLIGRDAGCLRPAPSGASAPSRKSRGRRRQL